MPGDLSNERGWYQEFMCQISAHLLSDLGFELLRKVCQKAMLLQPQTECEKIQIVFVNCYLEPVTFLKMGFMHFANGFKQEAIEKLK